MINNYLQYFVKSIYHRPVLWILILSLIVRSFYVYYYYSRYGYSNFGDGNDYISYAEQIKEQGIGVPNIDKIVTNGHMVGIGWPLILFFVFGIFGEKFWIVFVLNILLSSMHAVLIYLTGKEIFGKSIGIVAGLWSVLYINFIKFVPTVLKENINHFFLFLCLYLFILFIKRRNYKYLLLFSSIYACFIHLDERYFSFFPFFVLFFFLFKKKRLKAFKNSLIYIGLVLIIMIPWLIRNYQVYKRPVILSYQTSALSDKLLGYNPDSVVTGYKNTPSSYSREYLPKYEQITRDVVAGKQLDPVVSKYSYIIDIKEGISLGIIPHTFSYGKNIWEEFKEFFRPCRFYAGYMANGYRLMKPRPLFNNIVFITQYGILLPFFLLGIFYSLKNRNKLAVTLFILFIVYSIIHIAIFHVVERYRVPMDGIIIMTAFYGFFALKKIY